MSTNHKKRHRPAGYGVPPGARQVEQFRTKDFDRESGLVYDEVEVKGPNAYDMSWISNYRTPGIAKTRALPTVGKGARSLHEMALNKISKESRELSSDVLKAIPSSVGQLIWDKIVEDHVETYQIWRTFATAFGADFSNPSHRYMLDIKAPTLDHNDYYKGLQSKTLSWLVCLRISPKQTKVSDLVAISQITNLAVLDLSDGQLYMETRQSTFDHRVMRSWAELASSRLAFQNLRVLMLGWQEKLGDWVFDMLDDFPLVNLFVVTDCHLIDHKNHRDWERYAWDHGWKFMPSKRGVKHLRTLLTDPTFFTANISNLYYESVQASCEVGQVPTPGSARPLLECWLGAPRAWSHIIDDFPGTKTVIFQRKNPVKMVHSHSTTPAWTSNAPRMMNSAGSKLDSELQYQPSHSRRRPLKQSVANLLAEMS